MSNAATSKPEKPYKTFPLTPHNNGQWVKKIRGKVHYFGRWAEDPEGVAALNLYLEQRDDLHAGRKPRPRDSDEPTLADALNAFLSSKLLAKQAGELADRSYHDYERVCDRVAESIGKHRVLSDIDREDLEKLRAVLAKGKRGEPVAPKTLASDSTRARSIFLYANEFLLEKPVKYRGSLKSPSRRLIRQAAIKIGPRLFSAAEIQAIIDAADPTMKALVYLGINCAFGPKDCAELPVAALDLEGGWHDFARPKTSNPRRAKLWPETIDALREVITDRPLVFDLKTGINDRHLSADFRELLTDLEMFRKNVKTFYSLRRTFLTVATTCNEPIATAYVMGHVAPSNDMAAIYRQKVYDAALIKVGNHVRSWLLGEISIE